MTASPRCALVGCQLLAALLFTSAAVSATLPPAPAAAVAPSPPFPSAPRSEARFTPTLVYQDRVLSEDTVWRGEVLVEGSLTVAPQATLSIEPGTVVRFRRGNKQTPLLVVQGRLVAVGAKEAPILFTSAFAVPAASDWQGVMLLGSEKKNVLENCRIEGAQSGVEALFSTLAMKNVRVERSATGMRFQDTLLTMEGGGVFDCDLGLSLADSEATLRQASVEGNRQGISAKRSSLYLFEPQISANKAALSADDCRLKIQGGSVLGNGSGVTLGGCQGSVVGVLFTRNAEHALSLRGSRLRVNANQISGNGGHGLVVYDGASVAWDNAIYDNAGYDLYNAGTETFRAPGNWWRGVVPRIFTNGGQGKVSYAPVLGDRPGRL